MVLRWILPLLLLGACSQPTEFARDNPIDPTGASFELPGITGLAATRVGRHIRLAWTTPFNRYTIRIERSKNGGAFELRDTLQSNITSWTDTHVALPDSAIYRYRVFGTYLDRSSDTLMSHRITSTINQYTINKEFLDGQTTVRFTPFTVPSTNVVVSGDLQTFHVVIDSVTVSALYENGTTRYLRRLTQATFPNPRDTLAVQFLVRQHVRGRVIQHWTSRTLRSSAYLDANLHETLMGRLTPEVARINASGGSQAVILNHPNSQTTTTYNPTLSTLVFMSRELTDPVRSTVSVTTGRFIYSTQSGLVRSLVVSQGSGTHMDVPGPATILGAYYESGELVYVRSRTGQDTPATLERFNVFTQTPLLSVPIETASPTQVVDRPDLNEIWVFHRGLMRVNRTTGQVLQHFDSDATIRHVLIGNGRAHASFIANTPFVKTYDMATGAVTVYPIPFNYDEALFMTDANHIAYHSERLIRVFRLSRNGVVAENNDQWQEPPVGYLPLNSTSFNRIFYGYQDRSVIQLLELTPEPFYYRFHPDI